MVDPENEKSLSDALPHWILKYAKDKYGVDVNKDLGAGKEVPEKPVDPEEENDLDQEETTLSWWKTYWPDITVILVGVVVVGLLILVTIVMRLL